MFGFSPVYVRKLIAHAGPKVTVRSFQGPLPADPSEQKAQIIVMIMGLSP